MKNIILSKLDDSFVKFDSRIGNGIAIWSGEQIPHGSFCEIELDIEDYFEWGKNITLINEEKCSIRMHDNKLIFNAKVIFFENDGVLTISLDDDVIFIEVSKADAITDGYVSFFTTPEKVMLYPVDL